MVHHDDHPPVKKGEVWGKKSAADVGVKGATPAYQYDGDDVDDVNDDVNNDVIDYVNDNDVNSVGDQDKDTPAEDRNNGSDDGIYVNDEDKDTPALKYG